MSRVDCTWKCPCDKICCISLMIAAPTTSQLDWKKLAEKLSGPGALSGWIANIASLISSEEGKAVSCSFVSGKIHGKIALLTTSSADAPDEEKMSLKYLEITWAICSSSKTDVPAVSSITEIMLRARLQLVKAWKKVVFLSPRVSHSRWLRCFQNSSSAL